MCLKSVLMFLGQSFVDLFHVLLGNVVEQSEDDRAYSQNDHGNVGKVHQDAVDGRASLCRRVCHISSCGQDVKRDSAAEALGTFGNEGGCGGDSALRVLSGGILHIVGVVRVDTVNQRTGQTVAELGSSGLAEAWTL